MGIYLKKSIYYWDSMSFIKNLLDIREIKGPEFYKDFESENKQLYDLEELFSRVKSEKRKTKRHNKSKDRSRRGKSSKL